MGKKELKAARPNSTLPVPRDELGIGVAIKAEWSERGFSIAAQSRAVAAADRLLGGLIGIPAGYFEGIRARIEQRNQISARLNEVDGQKAMELVGADDQLGLVTAQRFLQDQRRKQANREAVWCATEDAIRALPPPVAGASPGETEAPIDEDWLNLFSRHAEDASTERLRELWGRILAGEVRKPGSFAPPTLRAIAELDLEVARRFEAIVKECIDDMWVKPPRLEGEDFERIAFLEEAGLISGADGNMYRYYSRQQGGDILMPAGNFLLKVVLNNKNSNRFTVKMCKLTRVGCQIASILERDELGAVRRAAKLMDEAESVGLLGPVSLEIDGKRVVQTGVIEVLKGKPVQ